jgi:hypothetical protein
MSDPNKYYIWKQVEGKNIKKFSVYEAYEQTHAGLAKHPYLYKANRVPRGITSLHSSFYVPIESRLMRTEFIPSYVRPEIWGSAGAGSLAFVLSGALYLCGQVTNAIALAGVGLTGLLSALTLLILAKRSMQ